MTTPYSHDPAQPSDSAAAAPHPGHPEQQPEHTVMLNRSQVAAPAPPGAPPYAAPGGGQASAQDALVTSHPQQQPGSTASGADPHAYAGGPPPQAPPQGGPAPAPPPGGYASPIPVTRTHLGHAIASEWTKIRSVRSTLWTLGIMFALVVGIGFLTAFALSSDTSDYIDMPLLGGGLFGLMLGQLCIITLGVLVITSEYGTGMIRATMTACPHRGRVLLAKALIFFLLAFVTTTLACALTALIQTGFLSGQTVADKQFVSENLKDSIEHGELIATGGEWLGATVGAGLYVALLGLLSLTVGAMLRHSAGSITAMMGLVLLPPLIAPFMRGESMKGVQEALLEYSPLNGLASLFHLPMVNGGMDTTGWPLLGLLAAVTGAALIGAYALLTTRDV